VIKRLRPTHSPETLAELYAKPYDSSKWEEHVARVNWTIERLNTFTMIHPEITTAVDLSCGDGRVLDALIGVQSKVYGDIAHAPHLQHVGDIYETIEKVTGDLLICSETLEHLDDPATLLDHAARRFKWICITTPLGENDPEKNYEHYWGWDLYGISSMLSETNWAPRWVDSFNQPYYTYQLWIARSLWV
jgi:hypothetical protein